MCYEFFRLSMHLTADPTAPLALPATGRHPLLPRPRYVVLYRLKLAEIRCGRLASTYFATCARRFDTDELTVILADLYEEVGPSARLMGLEILAVRRRSGRSWPAAA
jgi:hypothetical protein